MMARGKETAAAVSAGIMIWLGMEIWPGLAPAGVLALAGVALIALTRAFGKLREEVDLTIEAKQWDKNMRLKT